VNGDVASTEVTAEFTDVGGESAFLLKLALFKQQFLADILRLKWCFRQRTPAGRDKWIKGPSLAAARFRGVDD
jgi:hypothetical protein